MQAIWNSKVIAASDETVVVENNHYFPRDSLNDEFFIESSHTSECAWKGAASYYSISVDGEVNQDAAWYYPNPKPEASHIKDRVAFWRGVQVSE